MKLKLLLATVVFAGLASNLMNAGKITLENKMTSKISIGFCFASGGHSDCRGGDVNPGQVSVSSDIGMWPPYNFPRDVTSVYWANNTGDLLQQNYISELKLNNSSLTKFTVNPDGTISGSK